MKREDTIIGKTYNATIKASGEKCLVYKLHSGGYCETFDPIKEQHIANRRSFTDAEITIDSEHK